MILGHVTGAGEPVVMLPVAGRTWPALIDMGFNGDLELPEGLHSVLNAEFSHQTSSSLAAGQTAIEDVYSVEFPFDGEIVIAEASFAPGVQILIGTHLLGHYHLQIHFPDGTVHLGRVA